MQDNIRGVVGLDALHVHHGTLSLLRVSALDAKFHQNVKQNRRTNGQIDRQTPKKTKQTREPRLHYGQFAVSITPGISTHVLVLGQRHFRSLVTSESPPPESPWIAVGQVRGGPKGLFNKRSIFDAFNWHSRCMSNASGSLENDQVGCTA